MFRLITPNTLEERILSRARQKLVLDAMVIQKAGQTSVLSSEILRENDDTSEEAILAKLNLDEIWSFLSTSADKLRDPTADHRPPMTDDDVDLIITQGALLEGARGGEEFDSSMLMMKDETMQEDAEGLGEAEDVNSINRVAFERLATALPSKKKLDSSKSGGLAQRIIDERTVWPFYSPDDVMSRVRGCDEGKLKKLADAGIVIPKRTPGTHELAKMAAAVAAAEEAVASEAVALVEEAPAVGSRRKRAPPKRFVPPSISKNTRLKKYKLRHEDSCFSCGDGGDLLECQVRHLWLPLSLSLANHQRQIISFAQSLVVGTLPCLLAYVIGRMPR